MENFLLLAGFALTAYAVIANDVIQTLGTFISSNRKTPWWILFIFIGGILSATLLLGWFLNNGDVSYGRLENIPLPEPFHWWYLLPPLVLLLITWLGIPVSTTFMILSVFSAQVLIEKMIIKSVIGYAIAFIFAFLVYLMLSRQTETEKVKKKKRFRWVIAQWISTGLLWSQWLVQDFANIYVFLPRNLELTSLLISLLFILIMVAILLRSRGGKIQEIITKKTNTADIRSATLIDLIYAAVLFIFTILNPVPMSTTWVFIGILAGRELAIKTVLQRKEIKSARKKIFFDLYKVNLGLAISILITFIIKFLNG